MSKTDDKMQELKDLYADNKFMHYIGAKVQQAHYGYAQLSMFIDPNIHTNLHKGVHGGALFALADSAMGMACISTNKLVVTLGANANFIRPVKVSSIITASAQVIHDGRKTLVVDCQITDDLDKLVAKFQGTFFVIGSVTEDLAKQIKKSV